MTVTQIQISKHETQIPQREKPFHWVEIILTHPLKHWKVRMFLKVNFTLMPLIELLLEFGNENVSLEVSLWMSL